MPAGYVVDDTFLFSSKANEVITLRDDGNATLSPIDPAVASKVIVTSAIKRAMETYLSGKAVDDEIELPTPSMSESRSNSTYIPSFDPSFVPSFCRLLLF